MHPRLFLLAALGAASYAAALPAATWSTNAPRALRYAHAYAPTPEITYWQNGLRNASAFVFDDPEYSGGTNAVNAGLWAGALAAEYQMPMTWLIVGITLTFDQPPTFPGIGFVVTNTFTGTPLSNALRDDYLSGYVELGGHGWTHTNMYDQSSTQYSNELRQSLLTISNLVWVASGGTDSNHVISMGYPYGGEGGTNAGIPQKAQQVGWKVSRDTDRWYIQTNIPSELSLYGSPGGGEQTNAVPLWMRLRILPEIESTGAGPWSNADTFAFYTNQFYLLSTTGSNAFIPTMYHNVGGSLNTNQSLITKKEVVTNLFAWCKAHATNVWFTTLGNAHRYWALRTNTTWTVATTRGGTRIIPSATLNRYAYNVPLTFALTPPQPTTRTNWTITQGGATLSNWWSGGKCHFNAHPANGPIDVQHPTWSTLSPGAFTH